MRYDSKGFTLIELLIVVVIIGILVTIVVPKFANGKERAIVASMRETFTTFWPPRKATSRTRRPTITGRCPIPPCRIRSPQA